MTSTFHAAAITRAGHLEFGAPLAAVFPLFTPDGERHWAKGWDPQILHPRDGAVAEGLVFLTRDDSGTVVWTVTRYDAANHAIAYNVVSPDFFVRRIEVRCAAQAPGRTVVDVTDSYVGLSPRGNQFVDALTDGAYAVKMEGWKDAIGAHLAK